MLILAHRGLWRAASESNTLTALEAALAAGLGIETDIRDCAGKLAISHDPPVNVAIPMAALLELYAAYPAAGMLALNIKADGLQCALADALDRYKISRDRYFVFDMAVPDALSYLRCGMPCFTRQSEFEPVPAFLDRASGVWLDCFERDWIDRDEIVSHCKAGRRVALVSPELHGRGFQPAWDEWRDAERELRPLGYGNRLMICTDHPEEAMAHFHAPG